MVPGWQVLCLLQHELGRAYEQNIETGERRLLLEDLRFVRIHYTVTGDFLLTGRPVDAPPVEEVGLGERLAGLDLYWMRHEADAPPEPLDQRIFEGIAVSRTTNKIAFVVNPLQNPDTDRSDLIDAELAVTAGGKASLVNRQAILQWPPVASEVTPPVVTNPEVEVYDALGYYLFEAQDFTSGDDSIVFYGLPPEKMGTKTLLAQSEDLEVYEVDVETSEVTRHTDNGFYDEAEGVSPDGKFSFVETDRVNPGMSIAGIELHALRLDGTERHERRITTGTKNSVVAHQAVVSPDATRVLYEVGDDAIDMVEFDCADD